MIFKIMFFLITFPINALLIWSYFYPEESMLWGQRWMYKDEPELSEEAIRFVKFRSIVGFVLLSIISLIYYFK